MGRLFWKIFGWFLVTQIVLVLAMTWIFRPRISDENSLVRDALSRRLDVVAILLENGGLESFRKYEKDSNNVIKVWVLDKDGRDVLGRSRPLRQSFVDSGPKLERQVTLPDDKSYRLVIYRPLHFERKVQGAGVPVSGFPWKTALIIISCSLLASFWLAWYISNPLNIIRKATKTIRNSDGAPVKVAAHFGARKDELTELAAEFDRMTVDLDDKQQAMKSLLHDISHEIRTPLTRMRLQLGLIEQKHGSEAVVQTERLEAELIRLDELVDQILTVARLSSGIGYELNDHIELVTMVGGLLEDLRIETGIRNIEIAETLPEEERVIQCNKELLRRALENVLRNAVQHTPDNGKVRAVMTCSGKDLEIRIRDSGPGVDPANLDRIFQPFQRSDNRAKPGYGLGLAIAAQALERHGGTIHASNHPDGGLEITLSLPTGTDTDF